MFEFIHINLGTHCCKLIMQCEANVLNINKRGNINRYSPFSLSLHTAHFTAMLSISTKAPLGSCLTAKAERAGNAPLK